MTAECAACMRRRQELFCVRASSHGSLQLSLAHGASGYRSAYRILQQLSNCPNQAARNVRKLDRATLPSEWQYVGTLHDLDTPLALMHHPASQHVFEAPDECSRRDSELRTKTASGVTIVAIRPTRSAPSERGSLRSDRGSRPSAGGRSSRRTWPGGAKDGWFQICRECIRRSAYSDAAARLSFRMLRHRVRIGVSD